MKRLLFCMVVSIFWEGANLAEAAPLPEATPLSLMGRDTSYTKNESAITKPRMVESEEVASEQKALTDREDFSDKGAISGRETVSDRSIPSAKEAVSVSMPQAEDESWKKGINAFGNYDYEQAFFCFIESPAPLAKYYLAKIYFGDVFMNNLEGTSLPKINRQKAMEVLGTVINYPDAQELKNKYTSLMDSSEALSRFYYERGNYEEAEKAIEHVQGKEAEEIRHRYQLYTQSLKNPAPAHQEEAVFSEKPQLKLPNEKAVVEDTQHEPTFTEEKGKGHESFSETVCFVDGHHHQASHENDEMIEVDSHPSSAREHHSSESSHDEDVVQDESGADIQPRKSNTLISIKPAIVWDWPAMPGYDYKPVAQIATETKMVLLDDISTKWYYKVELPDSKVGYICSYLVKRLDDNKEQKKSVSKTETIEECTEYINYLVDRHEEEKKAAAKPKTQVKKKKPIAKKAAAKKQPAKSSGTHTVKPQAQPEIRFMDELPVKHPSPPPSSHEEPVHTSTEEEKH